MLLLRIRAVRSRVVSSPSSPSGSQRRWQTPPSANAPWRQTTIVDEWIQREARPVSLRQLTVFGRSLTKTRLLDSANYVRTELPTRVAHRLRDMQTLPYVVITNPHMSHVYELYFKAFDEFRRIPEIKTLEDNAAFCTFLQKSLTEHMTVIPRLVMGMLECQNILQAEATDKLMGTLLKSRISRRVIAEQHLALTQAFTSRTSLTEPSDDLIGAVFLRCNAADLVRRCVSAIDRLTRIAYGPSVQLPEVTIRGHQTATLTYIPAHLEYIVGELLRNSYQAIIEQERFDEDGKPAPVEVLICEAPQQVIFRISDRGGGVPQSILPYLWSFVKGPRKDTRLENMSKVPLLSATLQELDPSSSNKPKDKPATPRVLPSSAERAEQPANSLLQNPMHHPTSDTTQHLPQTPPQDLTRDTSLSSLSSRPPDLRLGIGLPMSRVYAEYWAGSLELHSLEGFGVDAFLRVEKLGNKNENLSMRASVDSL